ncbi:MAG TPA: flavodoxin family protein, partial [Rhodospirillales bacterium]|nr:flavodoxin family protein [Rhodospirillales bacterium]
MAGRTLLIVAHAPSPNTEQMRSAVAAGARSPEIEGAEVVVLSPFATQPEHVLAAQAIILGTTENLGYMRRRAQGFSSTAAT